MKTVFMIFFLRYFDIDPYRANYMTGSLRWKFASGTETSPWSLDHCIYQTVQSLVQFDSMKGTMKAGKKSASKSAGYSKLTEEKLVRLLQDDIKWDLQPLLCVGELLDMLDHVDDLTVGEYSEGRVDNRASRNEEECLKTLQDWLRNHSTCSRNDNDEQDWKFSNSSTGLDGTSPDPKGNR